MSRLPRRLALLQNPLLNNGTGFIAAERGALGVSGLRPPHVHTIEEQVMQVLANFHSKPDDSQRYIPLIAWSRRLSRSPQRLLCGALLHESARALHDVARSLLSRPWDGRQTRGRPTVCSV